MDPLTHLAHQRLRDLHATADAIRLERRAAAAPSTTPGRGDPAMQAAATRKPESTLGLVVSERHTDCEPEPRAA